MLQLIKRSVKVKAPFQKKQKNFDSDAEEANDDEKKDPDSNDQDKKQEENTPPRSLKSYGFKILSTKAVTTFLAVGIDVEFSSSSTIRIRLRWEMDTLENDESAISGSGFGCVYANAKTLFRSAHMCNNTLYVPTFRDLLSFFYGITDAASLPKNRRNVWLEPAYIG